MSYFLFIHLLALILDRDPGNVEVLTDLLLEKWRNVPEARRLGDETARFFRREMEKTWGQTHLAVLSEEEAQKWLLGVSFASDFYFRTRGFPGPFKILNQYTSGCIVHLILRTSRTLSCHLCPGFRHLFGSF